VAGFSAGPKLSWQLTDTGTTARFRGLSPVSASVAWVAGRAGTVLRTVDGGRHWASVGPADASALEFRDIEAFDARRAVAPHHRRGRRLPGVRDVGRRPELDRDVPQRRTRTRSTTA